MAWTGLHVGGLARVLDGVGLMPAHIPVARITLGSCPALPSPPQDSKKDYRTVLSRAALLGSIQYHNILNLVVPEVRQIFDLLTAEFSPLELCSRLEPLLARLQETTQPMSTASPVKDVALGQYVDSLKQVGVPVKEHTLGFCLRLGCPAQAGKGEVQAGLFDSWQG